MLHTHLTPEEALQMILRLKQGRNVIFGAQAFSVGRERLIAGANQVFEDIERTGESVVRLLRGDYGVGKTNFAARVFHVALHRGWVAAYVEISAEVKLHEFDRVFADIARKLYSPTQFTNEGMRSTQPAGVIGILDVHFRKLRAAIGIESGADLPASVRTDLLARVDGMLRKQRIHGDFASAVRSYVKARVDDDFDTITKLDRWFYCDPDISLPSMGVLRPISKKTGKEQLRCLSCLITGIGYSGTLIILDELEGIMGENKTNRRKAYTTLRELMDNVDGENGMRNTCFYAAAPPGQFESQKGFIEVEPLASRIQTAFVTGQCESDTLGTIIDLDRAPLTHSEQLELGRRIRAIHGVARNWNAKGALPEPDLDRLVKEINRQRPYSNLRVRDFCVEITTTLETRYGKQ
jgi:hypothetical protein